MGTRLENASWIKAQQDTNGVCLEFYRKIRLKGKVSSAILLASSVGMYIPYLDGRRIGDWLYTPYWTDYSYRIQYQSYDVTEMLRQDSELSFICAEGWAVGEFFTSGNHKYMDHISLIYSLDLEYADGSKEVIVSDGKTCIRRSQILFAQIYQGETIDYTVPKEELGFALEDCLEIDLVPMEGEPVREQEQIRPAAFLVTPAGERVIDFGQNMAGYVEICLDAPVGSRIRIRHGEVLDENGNLYTQNLRSAAQEVTYIAVGGLQIFKPQFTWQGFRYISLEEYPFNNVDLSCFKAVVVHSDMQRIGFFTCGNTKINRLYQNILWGQKSNSVDVPTDTPHRNERLGWTGDAQIICKTAALNYKVEKFYKKWLKDLALGQDKDGRVNIIVPLPRFDSCKCAFGWGDAATICPWEIYMAYGNKQILQDQFESMRSWVEYIYNTQPNGEKYLWLHYERDRQPSDWLALDRPSLREMLITEPWDPNCYPGKTNKNFLSSLFYARSTELLIKAGKVLGKDMTLYEELYGKIRAAFQEKFTKNGVPIENTQTAYAMALAFGMCPDPVATLNKLVELIQANGMKLTTGFLGTAYLLPVLSEGGRSDVAYDLLFQEKCPSWLYEVNHGATTIWEHWDGIFENGRLRRDGMNSYNTPALGAVGSWFYNYCAGIRTLEDGPGYTHVKIAPQPDLRMGFVDARLETKLGTLCSAWRYAGKYIEHTIELPPRCQGEIILPDGQRDCVQGGRHIYTVCG